MMGYRMGILLTENLDAFQNLDTCRDWESHAPEFEWTDDDLQEFEEERQAIECNLLAMAMWWECEGVRCATFGRDPNQNPYMSGGK